MVGGAFLLLPARNRKMGDVQLFRKRSLGVAVEVAYLRKLFCLEARLMIEMLTDKY